MNWNSFIKLVIAGFMIFVGTFIYLYSRQDIFFFRFVPDCIMGLFKGFIHGPASMQQYVVFFCLPDGLWYGALLLFQSVFKKNSLGSMIVFGLSIALPFILELLQLLNYVPGTFDPLDILTYFIVLIIFILCQKTANLFSFK